VNEPVPLNDLHVVPAAAAPAGAAAIPPSGAAITTMKKIPTILRIVSLLSLDWQMRTNTEFTGRCARFPK